MQLSQSVGDALFFDRPASIFIPVIRNFQKTSGEIGSRHAQTAKHGVSVPRLGNLTWSFWEIWRGILREFSRPIPRSPCLAWRLRARQAPWLTPAVHSISP